MDLTPKSLPFSNQAEQSVLGSVLIDPECLSDITAEIKVEEFYLDVNRKVFSAMQSLFNKSKTIDYVTLVNMLSSDSVFKSTEECQDYIRVIAEIVPSSSNVKDYVKIVHDKFLLRQIIEACNEISSNAMSTADDAENILKAAQEQFFNLSGGNELHGFIHMKDALEQFYSRINTIRENPEAVKGTQTGFTGLDNVLIGMNEGDLILVGARPGMGKTSFAMNIATQVARTTKKKVCIFSLEMTAEQLVSRMLSSEALIDSKKIRSGDLSQQDFENLAHVASNLSECEILIDDTSGTSVASMRSKLRKIDPSELALVVVDYLQLMQCDRKVDNRVLEVGEISRGLKLLAKDLRIPIICCAQLSRGPEQRPNKRPMLSDLRDSGAIEQDADAVIFLYREEYYGNDGKNNEPVQNTAEIIVAKNRHGETKSIEMGWLGQFTKFVTLDKTPGNEQH